MRIVFICSIFESTFQVAEHTPLTSFKADSMVRLHMPQLPETLKESLPYALLLSVVIGTCRKVLPELQVVTIQSEPNELSFYHNYFLKWTCVIRV